MGRRQTWAGYVKGGRVFHVAVRDDNGDWVTQCSGALISDDVLVKERRRPEQQVVLPAEPVKAGGRCKRCAGWPS